MNNILIRIPKFGQVAIVLTAATGASRGGAVPGVAENQRGGTAFRRPAAIPKNSRDAAAKLPEATAQVLAACAAYFVDVAFQAAEGLGSAANKAEDPTGVQPDAHPPLHRSRRHRPDRSGRRGAIIDLRRHDSRHRRSARNPARGKHENFRPVPRPPNARCRANFPESTITPRKSKRNLKSPITCITGKTRMFGKAHLRDNQGNVAQITIGYDGAISGSVTRDNRVIGRFEGKVAEGLNFKQFEIEGG